MGYAFVIMAQTRRFDMTPQEFMDEIVLPTVRELAINRRSRRHTYLASIVTFHIKDHLQKAGETGIENKMRAICGNNFDVVRAICNGTKHVLTNESHPISFSVGDDWDRPPAACGQMRCGISRLGDFTGGREIGNSGLNRKDIYSSIKAVLSAFCKYYPSYLGNSNLSDL